MDRSKFSLTVQTIRHEPLTAAGIRVLQVNLGYRCNMACRHCHVSAGPDRPETMDRKNIDAVLRVIGENPIETLDITGGAPELSPYFRMFVRETRKLGRRVIVRTNLTIFSEPGMEDLPEFYRDQGVELIASLPCYLENNVNAVRGNGAHQRSIRALRKLNRIGYGLGSSGPALSLVYNPEGAFLPPAQSALEQDYRRELNSRYNISFTRLYVFANMPVGRFRVFLQQSGTLEQYQDLLASAFNTATLDKIMCRSLVSVGWNGALHDCDFNQVLGIPTETGISSHISDFDYAALSRRRISVDDHCFGCTAGQGST
jgi:radical SAM/Cys-rich protein